MRRLLIVTGAPGTGKSTIAARVAALAGVPLLQKDLIKDPLLAVLGAAGPAESRRLSDAAFAALFALSGRLLATCPALVLEGNFRPEHGASLVEVLAGAPGQGSVGSNPGPVHVLQLLCTVEEAERRRRLEDRARRASRHPGHADARLATQAPAASWLGIPGSRLRIDTGMDRPGEGARARLDALAGWLGGRWAADVTGVEAGGNEAFV